MIYGFTDINFNIASSKMNEAGSYLFIPQVNFYLFAFFFFFLDNASPHRAYYSFSRFRRQRVSSKL